MLAKKDFIKINDFLWEIPRSFRSDMRVPARAFVTEKMLQECFKDRSLEQLVNISTLPGIQKYALAMPDMHEGYASPIGGVAAIRISDGIISPGMCVDGETKILHSLGYYLPIKEFENKDSEIICCARFKEKKIDQSSISKLFKLKINPSIFQIITKSGQRIKATGDHPFYTPKGMTELKSLKIGDKTSLYPFEGVSYKEPKKKILVTEEKIKKFWPTLGQNSRAHGLEQILNKLKKKNLLPFETTSSHFPYLLKIMGYLLGDGTMYFSHKRKRGRISFYGEKENLLLIKEDLGIIGFKPVLQKRNRRHKITTTYKKYSFTREEASLTITSTALVVLLHLLGMPVGNKSRQNFILPDWLFKIPLWQKRLFLAGFFGAELSSPQVYKKHSFNFYAPVLGVNKSIEYLESGRKFLQQISRLLDDFGIFTNRISQRKEQENKDGSISYRLRLILSSTPQNLINLWSKISYEYYQEKRFLSNLAVYFIKSKQRFIEEKILSQGIKARKGLIKFQKSEVRTIRELTKRGGKTLARSFIGQFPVFEEFIKIATEKLGKSGMVWDEIERVEKLPFSDYVYDFTVTHPDHNFIANNFVVSNCGYDINCGMKLLKSGYSEAEIKPHLDKLATEIQKEVPSGLGQGRQIKLSIKQIDKILEGGAKRMVEQGYGEKEDFENCEGSGRLDWADAGVVSSHAKDRGRDQVGTLGSGNHFLEIQKVAEIFDEKAAGIFGLFKDEIVIMIHCGSRGLGHQVCSDYLREFIPLMMDKYKIKVPDREFACVPFNSLEGQRYFSAMASAANYAWANRQMIAHFVRKAWQTILGPKSSSLVALYDVAHNIIKKEKYVIGGKETEVAVHRKGATRAFPSGSLEIPEKYREVGQPVIIPGSMGTASYILAGQKSGEQAFFSTCHGAGRTMSRHEAMRRMSGQEVIKSLELKGIVVKCWSFQGIAEEAPMAYKDVDEVVDVVRQAGLSKKVARLIPLVVIKGE